MLLPPRDFRVVALPMKIGGGSGAPLRIVAFVPAERPVSAERTIAGPADALVRTLSKRGGVAVRALVATRLVAEAARRHGTSPTASAALGRALMGAVLLRRGRQARDGADRGARRRPARLDHRDLAIAQGRARGYATPPEAQPPARAGRLDVAGAVGRGTLAVVRSTENGAQPYTGIVPLIAGTVAQDLAHYLSESEQIRSAVALGVFLGARRRGRRGRRLPGAGAARRRRGGDRAAPRRTCARCRARASWCARAGTPTRSRGSSRARSAAAIDTRSEPRFHCGCQRERVLRAVALLGRDDLARAASEGETLEVRCRFCAARYAVPPSDLARLVAAERSAATACARRSSLTIAHVTGESGFSGGEVQLFLLLEGLRARGDRALLVCPPGSRAEARGCAARLRDARGADARATSRSAARCADPARAARGAAPDLVHLHSGRANWLGGLAALVAGAARADHAAHGPRRCGAVRARACSTGAWRAAPSRSRRRCAQCLLRRRRRSRARSA